MHKKLESELMSLAHSILQMKNRDDVVALRDKAQIIYERLALLSYVDEFLETTPQNTKTKEELLKEVSAAIENAEQIDAVKEVEENVVEEVQEETLQVVEETIEEVFEEFGIKEPKEEKVVSPEKEVTAEVTEPVPAIENVDEVFEEVKESSKKQLTLEEEFKDAVSVDVTADLFQKAEEAGHIKPTLNDSLSKNKHIQVGLNDRIAFVKHLFNQSQSDFNRVLSQLNSIESEKEAKQFINKMVKPDYDWAGKEEYEERFMALIESRF